MARARVRRTGSGTRIEVRTWLAHVVFFFNDTATTEIYTLSLHDALPIASTMSMARRSPSWRGSTGRSPNIRSEEHTSELQSHSFISYAVFCLKKMNVANLVLVRSRARIKELAPRLALGA